MEIVRAEPSHEREILALATRTLGWDHDDRFRDLYRWKHDHNPVGPSPRWVALDGGRVVGFRVFLRWRFRRGARTAEAVRAVDTATDPDHQGRGIFRSLTTAAVDELTHDGVDFVFNTPNDQSRPGYLKMGWIDLGRPPVAIAPRLRALPRIARSRVAAELWSVPTEAGRPATEVFAEGADPLVPPPGVGGTLAWSTDRTPAFLRWRYGLPQLHYRVVTAADIGTGRGSAGGWAVLRLRRRGDALEAAVTELVAGSPRQRRRLLRAVLEQTGADHALVAGAARFDATPSVAHQSFSPLVTWRALATDDVPSLGDFDLAVGDLELF